MGFSLKKTIKSIAKNPLGELKRAAITNNPLIAQASALQRSVLGEDPKAPSPGEDPQVAALRDRLFGEAQEFDKGLSGTQAQASNQIEKEGNLALQSGLKGTKQNFNRRGLLYSGLREAGEQDVRGRVASGMAQQKAQSNKELTDLARAKWQKVAQVGLQGYQDSVNREAEISGINLQNQVARAQMMQALGQTGGQIAGSYYGSQNNSQQFRNGNLAADSYGWGATSQYGNSSPMANGGSFGQRGM